MPEYMTEDFYYLSPVIFDDVGSTELGIEYFLLSLQSPDFDSEKIIVYLNEELVISSGSEITFSNIWEFEVLGSISVGEEDGDQVLLTHDETISTWGEITLSVNCTASFVNTTIINSSRALTIKVLSEIDLIFGNITFSNCSFLDNSSIKIEGEYEDIETSGLISFGNCQFQSGFNLHLLPQPILITNSVFENSGIGGDIFRGNLTVDGNYFVKDDQSDDMGQKGLKSDALKMKQIIKQINNITLFRFFREFCVEYICRRSAQ